VPIFMALVSATANSRVFGRPACSSSSRPEASREFINSPVTVQRSAVVPAPTIRIIQITISYCTVSYYMSADLPSLGAASESRQVTVTRYRPRPYGDSVFFSNCSWEEGAEVPTATWTGDHPQFPPKGKKGLGAMQHLFERGTE
jgi:hypothetical protein